MSIHNATTQRDIAGIAAFYDALAPHFNAMAASAQRREREQGFFAKLVGDFHVRKALDAGSGSGFHSLLLASLGVEVVAVDASAAMIQQLAVRAAEGGHSVTAIHASFDRLGAVVPSGMDAVVCMGNTLAHAQTEEELRSTLAEFRLVLSLQGVLVIQIVNFSKMLHSGAWPSVRRDVPGGSILRSYGWHGSRLELSLELHEDAGMPPVRKSLSVLPITAAMLLKSLSHVGFGSVEFLGGFGGETYLENESPDLLVVAHR